MRFAMSLILIACFATNAHAQWRDICPDAHPDGVELPLNPLVAGTPASDEGITAVTYLTITPQLYGSPAHSFRVLSNGLLTFKYVDTYSLGVTSESAHFPVHDELHQLLAPFWSDLRDVRVCMLEESDRFTVQWDGLIAGSEQPVQFQTTLDMDGVVSFLYGPEHDPEAAGQASIGIESSGHCSGTEVFYQTEGSAEPMSGYVLEPNHPLWASSYTLSTFELHEAVCGDGIDGDGDSLVDCEDDDCTDATECESKGGAGGSGAVAVGGRHTCAITDDGGVSCWGFNGYGQLGYGNTSQIGDNELPATAGEVELGEAATQLTAGYFHTCALLTSGNVSCWGDNRYGQLGYGHTSRIGDNETPASAGTIELGGAAVQITGGLYHTCALLDDGDVRCWGYNSMGQLGYSHRSRIGDNEAPAAAGDIDLGGAAVQVVAGYYHSCALLDTGAARCWGYGGRGQLGHGNTTSIGDNEHPASAGDINIGEPAIQLTADYHNTCALTDGGGVRCWGANNYGQLGYGHRSRVGDNESPAAVGDVSLSGDAVQIGTGAHTCALLDTGDVQCWGRNFDGELGLGHSVQIGDDEVPSSAGLADLGGTVNEIFVGMFHTCAYLDAGDLVCWGQNANGQLGYGHSSDVGDNEQPNEAGFVSFQ